MAEFALESNFDALERAIAAAEHLEPRDAAAVVAARSLARKIDAWDIIVDFAMEDAAEGNDRPKVPANDNVSIATYLKYLERLRLVPPEVSGAAGSAVPQSPADQIEAMRKKLGRG